MEETITPPYPADDTSDSDDDLEEPPEFIKLCQSESATPDVSFEAFNYSPPKKSRRLDDLLAEHRVEEAKAARIKLLKEQLMKDIKRNSDEERKNEDKEDLASEHADHIEQLEVRSSELRHIHPGLPVFSENRFCCLFTENISPFSCGFTPSTSHIDRILANTKSANIATMMGSKVLVACVHQVSCLNSVMQWLLNLLSVHSSPVVVHSCYANLTGIINQQKISTQFTHCWMPSALDLLRLLVNLGASQSDLTTNQNVYTEEQIRKHLSKENDENTHQRTKRRISSLNVGKTLDVISACLQTKPRMSKDELNFVFYMLAKASLDVSLQNSLGREFQVCFSSILECYSENDWPSVVPELCRQLSVVTDHHHNQAYLVDLLPVGSRGRYLQVRLSFYFLRRLFSIETKLEDSQIHNLKLADLASLGEKTQKGHPSTLCLGLQDMAQADLYKLSSALKLLDFSVGDELHRSTQPKDQLENLLSQVNLVIKTMKDRVSELDVSKVKDAMSRLTIKWSLTLQRQRLTQKSIFAWTTEGTHQRVTEEILQDRKDDSDEA